MMEEPEIIAEFERIFDTFIGGFADQTSDTDPAVALSARIATRLMRAVKEETVALSRGATPINTIDLLSAMLAALDLYLVLTVSLMPGASRDYRPHVEFIMRTVRNSVTSSCELCWGKPDA